MPYTPKPLDTSDVAILPVLQNLADELARNTHENWAAQRIADGWTFGPRRDDALKQHPGLVPFEQLSEAEREYDRRTSLETLRALLVKGWRLLPPGGD